MKRTFPLFLAIFLLCAILAVPAHAAESTGPGRSEERRVGKEC